MKEADIRKYAALMKELELTGLEITEDNKVVRLERTQPSVAREPVVIQAPAAASAASEEQPATGMDDGCVVVKSPIVGVFYAAPAENAEPFVSIGDRVEKGQTLCILEAMKLMNEITAEESGIIEKISVTNGQVVEFGTELFRIRR
ncbi:MAG: acetyl-CoA carboxylase biotin carboxyl carrier protein [Clostridia bacterium]|nr:acetyl-CoA carboxylase biotin carboxyl carrier protein [Clostridia bacterium]